MSKFKILWIDDQKTKIKKETISVGKIIESLGFEPDICIEDNISEESLSAPYGSLYKKISARDVDLFVVDYNLKNDIFGKDILAHIRNKLGMYTDIVFYSSMPNTLLTEVKKSFDSQSIMDYYDGVYISPLGDEFAEKMYYIISRIIKSWYNVHSIRGIVLSKVSKFEHLISQIIEKNYKYDLETIKEKLDKKALNVCNATNNKWDRVKREEDPVPQILADPINFNWSVKKLILETLNDDDIVKVSSLEDIRLMFNLRNDFAHNPMHLKEGVLVLSKPEEDLNYTEEDIEQIREQIIRIESDLEDIISKGSLEDIEFGFGQELDAV